MVIIVFGKLFITIKCRIGDIVTCIGNITVFITDDCFVNDLDSSSFTLYTPLTHSKGRLTSLLLRMSWHQNLTLSQLSNAVTAEPYPFIAPILPLALWQFVLLPFPSFLSHKLNWCCFRLFAFWFDLFCSYYYCITTALYAS